MRNHIIGLLLLVQIGCSTPGNGSGSAGSSAPQANMNSQQPYIPAQAGFDDPKVAATNALANLRKVLAAGQNSREMGFDSIEQVDTASLGEPIQLYTVGIDQLSEYVPTKDPQSLLVDTHRLLYPVIANGRGRVLIALEMKDSKWHFVSFADQHLADNLVRVRRDKSSAPGSGPVTSYFMVQVKGLFLSFLGNRPGGASSGSSLLLVPLNGREELRLSLAFRDNHAYLIENPNFNAEDEGGEKAKDVFSALSKSAKKIDASKPF